MPNMSKDQTVRIQADPIVSKSEMATRKLVDYFKTELAKNKEFKKWASKHKGLGQSLTEC